VAVDRTLEQKIADAGPFNQRIEPNLLTVARRELEQEGVVNSIVDAGVPWYFLTQTPNETVQARLSEQRVVHVEAGAGAFKNQLGQALEIAIFRAMRAQNHLGYLGGFLDLDDHDDSQLYRKEEPPSLVNGIRLSNGRLDFIFQDRRAGNAGVEAKNIRNWIYPNSREFRELIRKCCELDMVPVLIARRIAYITRSEICDPCGIIIHETYNQLYPESASALAARARDKRLLGYHDIRVGNQPDARLITFLHTNLPRVVERARERFNEYRDLLTDYGAGLSYRDFYVELRIRRGIFEPPEQDDNTDDDDDYNDY
jgi:hypothetical protein